MTENDRDQPHGLGLEDQGEQPREEDIERGAATDETTEEAMAAPGAPKAEEAERADEKWDNVTEASVESFPASDAPGWTHEG